MPKVILQRYYGGCEHVDVVENLARDRANNFLNEHANVQPHSGSQAIPQFILPCLSLETLY